MVWHVSAEAEPLMFYQADKCCRQMT